MTINPTSQFVQEMLKNCQVISPTFVGFMMMPKDGVAVAEKYLRMEAALEKIAHDKDHYEMEFPEFAKPLAAEALAFDPLSTQ